jgi:hypothetical protein
VNITGDWLVDMIIWGEATDVFDEYEDLEEEDEESLD